MYQRSSFIRTAVFISLAVSSIKEPAFVGSRIYYGAGNILVPVELIRRENESV